MDKLDYLVNFLKQNDEDTEAINTLILKYYGDRNSEKYIFKDACYQVISDKEVEDYMYSYAEDKFYELDSNMQRKISHREFGEDYEDIELCTSILKDCIMVEEAIQNIVNFSSYEECYNMTLLDKGTFYNIYEEQ